MALVFPIVDSGYYQTPSGDLAPSSPPSQLGLLTIALLPERIPPYSPLFCGATRLRTLLVSGRIYSVDMMVVVVGRVVTPLCDLITIPGPPLIPDLLTVCVLLFRGW